jgi:hypothetical protein
LEPVLEELPLEHQALLAGAGGDAPLEIDPALPCPLQLLEQPIGFGDDRRSRLGRRLLGDCRGRSDQEQRRERECGGTKVVKALHRVGSSMLLICPQ